MKRLIITGPRQTSFEEVEMPACPPDGLLIRARLTAVSIGTEIRVYRWIPVDDEGKYLHGGMLFPDGPVENGYSMLAEVVEVGPQVTGFAPGDRVFTSSTHKEYDAVPAGRAMKVPASLKDEHAVFLNIIGVGLIGLRDGKPGPGENIAVVGLGPIGLSALAYSVAFGFRTVALDFSAQRRAIATQMGADLALDPREEGAIQRVVEFCGGQGADVVLEAASSWKAIRLSMDIARTDGSVVVVARHTDKPDYNPVGHPYLSKRLNMRTSYGYDPDGGRWDRARSLAMTLEMLEKGSLPIDPMITHRFRWDELPDVYARLDRGDTEVVGAVIEWR